MNALGALLCIWTTGSVASFSTNEYLPGDVILAGLFSIQSHTDETCGAVVPESIQAYEAVRWFIGQLNDRNYTNGVKFGLHAFKTCGIPSMAVATTLDILQTYKQKQIYGVIGPEFSSETQEVSRLLSSLPERDRLLQISFSATAAILADKSIYKNLYRVIETDDVQVNVMLKLLQQLKWNYIAIVYEADTYGEEGANALKAKAEENGICVPQYVSIATDASSDEYRIIFESIKRKLEVESESPVLGLVFWQAETAKIMFEFLNIKLSNFQMIVSESIRESESYLMKSDGSVYPLAKGLLTPSPPYYDVELFKLHWQSLHTQGNVMREYIQDDDWLLKYMEQVTKCSLANETNIPQSCIQRSTDSVQNAKLSIYTNYALMAAAAFAKTYKTLYEKKCPRQTGVCKELDDYISNKAKFIEEMAAVEVNPAVEFWELSPFQLKFRFRNGELTYTESGDHLTYIVYNYQKCSTGFCNVKVGDYVAQDLTLLPGVIKSYNDKGEESSNPVQAQCQETRHCSKCQNPGSYGEVIFLPGDFYVVGLVPIHDQGADPLHCGELRTAVSVDLAEGIVFAVNRANAKRDRFTSLLGSKTIGLLLLDTCNTPTIARERVTRLHRGVLRLTDSLNSSSIVDKIIGYIGPHGSSVSVTMSILMTELNKLFISYASTSSTLSSRSLHPNFMRTCSPDHEQADVIMYLAKEIGSTYVQIIHTDGEYGTAGLASLMASGKKYKICVANTIAVKQGTSQAFFRGYVSELRRFPHAKLVVIFVSSNIAPQLMTALSEEMNTGEFVFIGGESWGKRGKVIEGNNKLLGSLSLAQELPKNQAFEEYFSGVNVSTSKNPWLESYLELTSNCYFPMSYNKLYRRPCTSELLAQNRKTDTWVPFAINGVYSLILGFSTALEEKCYRTYTMCPEYSTAELIANVKNVRLDIYNDGGNIRVFDDNGEGSVGYKISQIVRDAELVYKEVGLTSEDGIQFFKTRLSSDANFASNCQNDVECGRCNAQFSDTTNISSESGDRSAVIGLGVFVALLLVVIIGLLVVGVICWRKKRKPDVKEGTYTDVYLHPVGGPHYDSISSIQLRDPRHLLQITRVSVRRESLPVSQRASRFTLEQGR
ncbi:LOW QUALITY PROTEIN: uncharacterized protein LOC124274716 [Haliotis rubra]|uniref:LOW QUALITY PROTEIN: uncharacterized protein LOC124274716 n=1 Tax=Haliotis rubra TaxID=36100 RepID=UPI001EE51C55|nr:LOW QUALITY PROTEIN: uncharacterized protein LOC124274716 [Haliotis rubra]